MKKVITTFLAVILTCGSVGLFGDQLREDYTFNQERMIVDNGTIFLISTFDTMDGVTAYDYYGRKLWQTDFHAKIISWNVSDGLLLVFSKNRNGNNTYITCLDRYDGSLIWQRP